MGNSFSVSVDDIAFNRKDFFEVVFSGIFTLLAVLTIAVPLLEFMFTLQLL